MIRHNFTSNYLYILINKLLSNIFLSIFSVFARIIYQKSPSAWQKGFRFIQTT